MIIERYIVCEKHTCFFILPMHQLNSPEAEAHHCTPTGARCKGRMFVLDGVGRRRPIKVMPFTPLSKTLRLFMREPGFVEAIQRWRGDNADDQVKTCSPVIGQPAKDTKMHSIFDGLAWRSRDANRVRHVEPDGVREEIVGQSQRLVSLKYGLLVAINIDW
jgi:hypothetical protein